jgi:hypothetical protein
MASLRMFTGQDFGQDVAAWGEWLRGNRWVYSAKREDPRLTSQAGSTKSS